MKEIRFFLSSPVKDKYSILRAFYTLLKVCIIVKYRPLKSYFEDYFIHEERIKDSDPLQLFFHEVRLFKKAIKKFPVKTTCLIESMALKLFMKHYNVDFPIFIGLNTCSGLKAHAWCNEENRQGYDILKIQ